MFFLGLLVLCAAGFLVGFLVRRMMVVSAVAALGVAVVVIGGVTTHTENPALVAVVQLVCTTVIAGCSALGVIARRETHRPTR
jgi:hypothetical protein